MAEDRTRAFRKPTISETLAGATAANNVHYQSVPWGMSSRVRQSKNDTALTTKASTTLTTYDGHKGPSYVKKPDANGKLPRTYVVLARKNENKDSQDDKDLQNLIIVDSKIISDKIELDLQKRGVKLENLVGSKSFQTFSQKNQEKLLQRLMPHSSRRDVSSYMTARARERGIKGISPQRPDAASGLGVRGTSPMRDKRYVAPAPTGTTQAHDRVLSTVAETETARGQHTCTRTEALANRITNNSRTDTLKTETIKSDIARNTATGVASPSREMNRYGRIRREAFQSPTRNDFQQLNRNLLSRAESYHDKALEQTIALHLDSTVPNVGSNDLKLPNAMRNSRAQNTLRPDIQVIPRPIGPAGLPDDDVPGVNVSDWLQRSKTPNPRLSVPSPPVRPVSRGVVNEALQASLLRRPKNPTNRMASANHVMTDLKKPEAATPVVETVGKQSFAVLPNQYGPTDAYHKCLNWINSLPESFEDDFLSLDMNESQSSSVGS